MINQEGSVQMRKIILKSLITLMAIFSIFAPMALLASGVNVYIGGVQLEFGDQQPVFMGSGARTLVPVRAVFEQLDFDVRWDGTGRRVILTRGSDEVSISVGTNTHNASSMAIVNGQRMPIGMPAMIFDDRTLMPINSLLEAVGHPTEWDNDTRTLRILDLRGHTSWEYIPNSLENQISPPAIGEQFAIIHTTFGEIHLRLFPDLAPLAVENFITHAMDGYYNGIAFHRIIEGFMIQSGDPQGTGQGGQSIWGMPFGNEVSPNLRHISGALSMANAVEQPISNNSQFFIVQGSDLHHDFIPTFEEHLEMRDFVEIEGEPTLGELFPSEFEFIEHYLEYGGWPHLDFESTVFGHVFEGMNVVNAIAAVQVDGNNRPLEDVMIIRIDIETR